jgi:hypothetical protein
MKKVLFILLITSIILTIAACGVANKEMTLLDHMSSISFSKSQGFGALNKNFSTIYHEKGVVSVFEGVIKNAKGKRENSIENINEDKPDYDILVEYVNGDYHLLHLILGQEGQESILMYVGNEYNLYYVTPEDTKKLRKIVKEH